MLKLNPSSTGHIKKLLVVGALVISSMTQAATTYQPTWASVDQHTPAPEWFQDAKFGIYFHFGAFGVPEYGSEWYPRNMFITSSKEYNHQLNTYGDPFSVFGYDKFLTGQNDLSGHYTKFAPVLKSSGGNFDPNEWAQLFSTRERNLRAPLRSTMTDLPCTRAPPMSGTR